MGRPNSGERTSGGLRAYALLDPLQQVRGYMEAPTSDHPEALAAAMGVLDRHLAALNSGDAVAGSARKPICRTFTPAWGMNGTTALGIFVTRSVPVQTKCT